MPPSSIAVPFWYETASPPTPLPLLASETDIPDMCFDVVPLSRQEVDVSNGLATSTGKLKSRTITFDVPTSTSAGKPGAGHTTFTPERGSTTDSDSDSSGSTGSTESEPESQNDADMKIAKPAGEVGRPGRGGYSLDHVLNWDPRRMSKFKKMINKLVGEYLNPTRSLSGQSLNCIALLHDKAETKFPELDQYENLWPVMDAVKQQLKYMSSKARKHAREAVALEAPKRKSGKKLRSCLLQGD